VIAGKSIATIGLLAEVIAFFCYFVSKVWAIFCAWSLILSIVIELFAETVLGQLIGSKKKNPTAMFSIPRNYPNFCSS